MRQTFFILLCLLLSAATAFAELRDVLIFPSGALLTETATLAITDGNATFELPGAADPESLRIGLAEKGIAAGIVNLRTASLLKPAADLSRLEKQLDEKKTARQGLQDQLQISRLGLSYWDSQKSQQLEDAEDIAALGEMIVTSAAPLQRDISRLNRELAAIDKEIRELEQQVARSTGMNNRVWQVTLDIATKLAQIPVSYSYRVGNATWTPLYSLDARPAEKQVNWTWKAAVQQATGRDWNNVNLRLATREPRTTLTPPEVGTWVIGEHRVYPAASRQMLKSEAVVAEMDTASFAGAPSENEVSRDEGTLFDIYNLGQHSIKAGATYDLVIDGGAWPATFSHLARPLISPQAFLTAKLQFDELVPLPSGQATLLVDGVLIGKKPFSLQEKEQDISFGSDPGIAIRVARENIADQKGLFSKTRSLEWNWSISIANNRPNQVDLRVEDSYPQVRDKRITLEENYPADNAPEREENLVFWSLTIPAGTESHLSYGYRISYPDELSVAPGR